METGWRQLKVVTTERRTSPSSTVYVLLRMEDSRGPVSVALPINSTTMFHYLAVVRALIPADERRIFEIEQGIITAKSKEDASELAGTLCHLLLGCKAMCYVEESLSTSLKVSPAMRLWIRYWKPKDDVRLVDPE